MKTTVSALALLALSSTAFASDKPKYLEVLESNTAQGVTLWLEGEQCGLQWDSDVLNGERNAKWNCKGNADAVKVVANIDDFSFEIRDMKNNCGLEWHGEEGEDPFDQFSIASSENQAKWDCNGNADPTQMKDIRFYDDGLTFKLVSKGRYLAKDNLAPTEYNERNAVWTNNIEFAATIRMKGLPADVANKTLRNLQATYVNMAVPHRTVQGLSSPDRRDAFRQYQRIREAYLKEPELTKGGTNLEVFNHPNNKDPYINAAHYMDYLAFGGYHIRFMSSKYTGAQWNSHFDTCNDKVKQGILRDAGFAAYRTSKAAGRELSREANRKKSGTSIFWLDFYNIGRYLHKPGPSYDDMFTAASIRRDDDVRYVFTAKGEYYRIETGPTGNEYINYKQAVTDDTWPGLANYRFLIRAAFRNVSNDYWYFFLADGKYLKYDIEEDKVLSGYPAPINEQNWGGLEKYKFKITAAFEYSGYYYIFLRDGTYLRYEDIDTILGPSDFKYFSGSCKTRIYDQEPTGIPGQNISIF